MIKITLEFESLPEALAFLSRTEPIEAVSVDEPAPPAAEPKKRGRPRIHAEQPKAPEPAKTLPLPTEIEVVREAIVPPKEETGAPEPITIESLKSDLMARVKARGYDEALAVLSGFKVSRLTVLRPSQYAAARDALRDGVQ